VGAVADAGEQDDLRERLVLAALRVAGEHGLAELTVRRIAEAAGTSTMSVYSRFGGRTGVLEALYQRAYDMLGEVFAAVPRPESGPRERLVALAMAYREFALDNPSRYAFMFHRDTPDFEPDGELRARAVRRAFGPLIEEVHATVGGQPQDAVRTAYWVWCVMHGLVGLELVNVLATPVPEWGVTAAPGPEAGERMYRAGVLAMLAGLGVPEA
jgi:AcrR family transcriptional regulator